MPKLLTEAQAAALLEDTEQLQKAYQMMPKRLRDRREQLQDTRCP
jgi:hypothetical protein